MDTISFGTMLIAKWSHSTSVETEAEDHELVPGHTFSQWWNCNLKLSLLDTNFLFVWFLLIYVLVFHTTVSQS